MGIGANSLALAVLSTVFQLTFCLLPSPLALRPGLKAWPPPAPLPLAPGVPLDSSSLDKNSQTFNLIKRLFSGCVIFPN